MFPPEPAGPSSEREVYQAFRMLNDDWMVFHGVKWIGTSGRDRDGEADFIVVHPHRGVLVAEVKGGRQVGTDQGHWYSVNRATKKRVPIKDPFEQAQNARYRLARELGIKASLFRHAVVLPGVSSPTGDLPLHVGPDVLLTADDLRDAATVRAAIERCAPPLSPRIVINESLIVGRLAPSTELALRLDHWIRRSTEGLTQETTRVLQYTEAQFAALESLRRSRRALVIGRAGTGKTMLAIARSQAMHREGIAPLLLCHHGHLAQFLLQQLTGTTSRQDDRVITLRQLAHRLYRDVGRQPTTGVDAEEFRWVVKRWTETHQDRYAALVVDEAQEFPEGVIGALTPLLVDPHDSPMYVFGDPFQSDRTWRDPIAAPVYALPTNCRNTMAIATVVARLHGASEVLDGVDGPDPRFATAHDKATSLAVLSEMLQQLRREGTDPESNATIVTCGTSASQVANDVRRHLKRDGWKTRTKYNPGARLAGVQVCTLDEFRGMEDDIVVVIVSDQDVDDTRLRAELYSAVSRARAVLAVIAPFRIAEMLGAFGSASPADNSDSTLHVGEAAPASSANTNDVIARIGLSVASRRFAGTISRVDRDKVLVTGHNYSTTVPMGEKVTVGDIEARLCPAGVGPLDADALQRLRSMRERLISQWGEAEEHLTDSLLTNVARLQEWDLESLAGVPGMTRATYSSLGINLLMCNRPRFWQNFTDDGEEYETRPLLPDGVGDARHPLNRFMVAHAATGVLRLSDDWLRLVDLDPRQQAPLARPDRWHIRTFKAVRYYPEVYHVEGWDEGPVGLGATLSMDAARSVVDILNGPRVAAKEMLNVPGAGELFSELARGRREEGM